MQSNNLLGRASWDAMGCGCKISGTDPIWRDRNATPEELLAATPESHRERVEWFVLMEYQKVGRTIKRVEIKEHTINRGEGPF